MKNQLRDFLQTDLQFIKGVGPAIAAKFEEVLGGRRILNFLLHKPSYVRPREITENITNAQSGDTITVSVFIKSHKLGGKFGRGRRPTQILCNDKFGNNLTIQFFHINYLDYWLEKLLVGSTQIISGKLEISSHGYATINHPEFIESPENIDKIPSIQAIYPSGAGLTQKNFANVRDGIFHKLSETGPHVVEGWAKPGVSSEISEFFDALRVVHFPKQADDLLPNSDAMIKLAYAELLAGQSAIVISRKNRKSEKYQKPKRQNKRDLLPKFYAALPFELTNAQTQTISEIFADMDKTQSMMRMIQGDVGSGKTIVAAAAAVKMASGDGQTALMAPTDTLALQHYEKLKPMFDSLGLVCEILTGRDKGKARNEKLISIKSGRTKLIIGTHALFSDDVIYKDLGLVVIDEQHRFGVMQRETLRQKGNNPDLLSLSATPIPRSLSMTIYGDMDISIINEKPAGRLPIKTSALPMNRIIALVGRLKPQIENSAKIFWVCPLVEESEISDLTAAEGRHKFLQTYFKNVGLVHGKMDKRDRDKIMSEFANGKMQILVSTTVIEVGIDVPAATIMIIENAERFGLSALHQLRGRVGRGNTQSFCILIYGNNITENGLKRLDVLCNTTDGFIIAEQDLIMRGTGELLGLRQSGWLRYNFVDYSAHRDLFKLAMVAAKDMKTTDEWTRDLMFIFGHETGVGA